MTLPTWVDFEFAERAAAVMARGLTGSSAAWGRLFSDAQAVLSSRTDTRDSERIETYEFHEWCDLIAAARVLDLGASGFGVNESIARRNAAILAACAFGMCGTAVSASAVIEAHSLLDLELSPGELTAIALSSPELCRRLFTRLPRESNHQVCVENVTAFLAIGREELIENARVALDAAIWEESSPWDSYLLRLSRLSLAHIGRLAVSKVLSEHQSCFPSSFLDLLISDSPTLLPSQFEAIKGFGVVEPERNLLVTLPTGTGKTLLGEIALLSSLGKMPGLACYVAPYVALGRQVADKIRKHSPSSVRVHRLMGGYREPEALDPTSYQEVVVATPERFDAMLRFRKDLLQSIRCVVFDESHMIGNGQRGIRVEGLITRLRMSAQSAEQVPRFVLLSAVLSNSDALASWIELDPENIVSGTWRPCAKRLLRWSEDGSLKLFAGDDPLRKEPSQILGEAQLPWPNAGFYQSRHFGRNRKQELLALENVAYLADFEFRQYQQPVLCICSTRHKTRRLASLVADRFPVLDPPPEPIMHCISRIDRKYPYLRPLKNALLRGVTFHNSTLPKDLREAIERAVESRALRVVAATTTLAEGVDLPFRVTILADWLTYDGRKDRPMESLLFKNIAGRCGRAGQFTEGDTIVFDNPVGDPRVTSPSVRRVLQDKAFFAASNPTLKSAIGIVDQEVAASAVGSQLLAAIPENPCLDDLLAEFQALSFASHTQNPGSAATRIQLAFKEIIDDTSGEPLAIAASPAQLTEFGSAACMSGLSPKTARRLRTELGKLADRGDSREDLISIGKSLLERLGDVDEQVNPDLRRAVTKPGSRPTVRLDALELVLNLWLSGKSYESIFAEMPVNKRSKRQPPLEEWLAGTEKESSWFDEFAKFQEFMSSTVEYFLPWLFRAARPIAELDCHPEKPWLDWARFVELGVDNSWAAQLQEDEVLEDRGTARELGRKLETVAANGKIAINKLREISIEVVGTDEDRISRIVDWYIQFEK